MVFTAVLSDQSRAHPIVEDTREITLEPEALLARNDVIVSETSAAGFDDSPLLTGNRPREEVTWMFVIVSSRFILVSALQGSTCRDPGLASPVPEAGRGRLR